jgi:histidine triad (HIT) family protein
MPLMNKERTIFERIVTGEVPHRKLYEDDLVFAFLDAFPNHPGHSLVISKAPYRDVFELPDDVAARMLQVARDLAAAIKEVAGTSGVNIVMNNGAAAGQVVFHSHMHVIPRRENDGGYLGRRENFPSEAAADEFAAAVRQKLGEHRGA